MTLALEADECVSKQAEDDVLCLVGFVDGITSIGYIKPIGIVGQSQKDTDNLMILVSCNKTD